MVYYLGRETLSDTTNGKNAPDSERLSQFIEPEVQAARDAGIPEKFNDHTAVFIHRTAAAGGYILAAFSPEVLVQWAKSERGFNLQEVVLNFLPYGMPVLGLGLEDNDATKEGEVEADDQQ